MIGLWLPKGNLINVGDVYEDCAYAVAVCTEVTSYRWTSGWRRWTPFTSDQDVIGVTEEGKGSSCSARHCRPVVITRAKHASVRWHHGTPLIGQRGDDSQRGDDLEEAVRRHGRDDSQGSCGPVPGRDGSQSISGWLAGEAEERADAEERGEVDQSEEHTSELQSLTNLVCRLLLEKKKRPAEFSARLQDLWTYELRHTAMFRDLNR